MDQKQIPIFCNVLVFKWGVVEVSESRMQFAENSLLFKYLDNIYFRILNDFGSKLNGTRSKDQFVLSLKNDKIMFYSKKF